MKKSADRPFWGNPGRDTCFRRDTGSCSSVAGLYRSRAYPRWIPWGFSIRNARAGCRNSGAS